MVRNIIFLCFPLLMLINIYAGQIENLSVVYKEL